MSPGLMSREGLPCHVTFPMMHVMCILLPHLNRRHLWKHYLPKTSFAGGKNLFSLGMNRPFEISRFCNCRDRSRIPHRAWGAYEIKEILIRVLRHLNLPVYWCLYNTFFLLPPATLVCGKVMLSQVCPRGCVSQNAIRQGVSRRCISPTHTHPWTHTPWTHTPGHPAVGITTEAGGMHPTGMQSCYDSDPPSHYRSLLDSRPI